MVNRVIYTDILKFINICNNIHSTKCYFQEIGKYTYDHINTIQSCLPYATTLLAYITNCRFTLM